MPRKRKPSKEIDDSNRGSSGSPEDVPYQRQPKKEESEDEDDEGSDEEYVVEKIKKHDFTEDGVLIFLIKWQGYSKKEDMTWEPEENLDGARKVLEDYFKQLGGRPSPGGGGAKRKRKSNGAGESAGAPGKKRGRRPQVEVDDEHSMVKKERKGGHTRGPRQWEPPEDEDWEKKILSVDLIKADYDKTTGERTLKAMVTWLAGDHSEHPLSTLNAKCPQKMLQYYERHLEFRSPADQATAGGDKAGADQAAKEGEMALDEKEDVKGEGEVQGRDGVSANDLSDTGSGY